VETGPLVSVPTWLERLRRSPSALIARQLAAAGIRVEAFRLADLSRIASLGPGDLDLEQCDDPVGSPRLADAPAPIRLGACERSGRTIVVTFTAADLERAAATGARAFAAAGIEPGMKVANTLEGGLETPGSLIVGDALERLRALDVPLGPVRDEKTAKTIAAMIDRLGVDVLIGDARSAGALLRELRAAPPRSWRGTLWLGAERPAEDFGGWWRRWISLPEVSVFLAVECGRGSLHLDPDVHLEMRAGAPRLSSLAGDAPLLAYEAGMPLRAAAQACACGDPRTCVEIAGADLTRPPRTA
jgi:hypothetical protein